MERIAIIGVQGSGKSTFANKLGKLLNREVIHLDKLYYKKGWQPVSKEEWKKIRQELLSRKQWIIDGNYQSSLDERLDTADTIIFFDFPKYLCLYRALKRAFKKGQPYDKAEGNKEKLSWDLVKKILLYPRETILTRLKQQEKHKKVYIVSQRKEVDTLIKLLTTHL